MMNDKRCYKTKNIDFFKLSTKFQVIIAMITLLICLSSFSFSTWAWFTDTDTISTKIQLASYDIKIDVKSSTDEKILLDVNSFKLSPNQTYTVTLTASGTATTGFALVMIGDQEYYTQPIVTDEGKNILIFKIESYIDGDIVFTPQWGTYDKEQKGIIPNQMIKNGETLILGDRPKESEEIMIESPMEDNQGTEELPVISEDNVIIDGDINMDSTIELTPEIDGEIPTDDSIEDPIISEDNVIIGEEINTDSTIELTPEIDSEIPTDDNIEDPTNTEQSNVEETDNHTSSNKDLILDNREPDTIISDEPIINMESSIN